MNAVTHLEKVIVGEVSAVTHLEKVIAGETSAVTYTEKVITGEAPPITHLQRVIAGVESPVTHLEYIWAGGSPTPTEHEYTGVVPYTFRADGTPLLDWYIKGNTIQNGTPTPDNPIMPQGCGDMTGNLCLVSQSNSIYYGTLNRYSVSNNSVTVTGEALFGFICKVSPNTDYTVSAYVDIIRAQLRIREYSNVPTEWSTNFVKQPINKQLTTYADASFTTDSLTNYLLVVFYAPPATTRINISNIMLNTGSTALPYEPYGYKIPIICGGTITTVYIGTNPLRKSLDGTAVDELSSNGTLTQRVDTDGSVLPTPIVSQIDTPTIPTVNGSNTFDVDTTVKPSEIYIKYKGV